MVSFSRLILLACWFGAALFFGAVVAPAAFGVLRSFGLSNANEIAGSIVTRSLSVINIAGFLISLLLLAADDARGISFNNLHGYSVNALGLAMSAALVAMVLMGRNLRS